MTTPSGGYGSYEARVSPPGGMGITTQGFGQEGYVLVDEQQMPKPPDEAMNFSVGVPYYLPFATPYRDSWEIFRDDPITVRQLVTMRRRDGQARALYRLLTKPILASLKQSDVIPLDGEVGGMEEAKHCKDLLFLPPSAGGMTHSFTRFVKQMLLALFSGFSAWEFVYWVPDTGPNKGKVCIRKLDWRPSETLTFLTDGQGEFNGFRQRCMAGDVRTRLLDGTTERMDRLVERWDAGERFWVYSCTEDGRIVPGRVLHAKKVSDSEPLVEVELDNGEKVKCTLTHPWMLRDGTYKRAANLKPGDSLMPLYCRDKKPSPAAQEYEQVWHPGTGKWEYTHRMVSRDLGFGARHGEVIHHWFDGLCHRNNDPRNLERMTRQRHGEVHREIGQRTGPESIRKAHAVFMALSPEERSLIGSERARVRWQDPEYRAGGKDRLEAARAGTDPSRWGRHVAVTFGDIDQAARAIVSGGSRLTWQAVADKLSCSQDVIYARVRAAGYESWKQYKWTLARRDAKWARKTAAPENHKVVAIRLCAPEPVYDIEVDKYHNFALAAGVFVHNTFFQGRTIDVKIPKDTALYYSHDEAERPFYGVSMFESAFYHYDKKEKLYYIAHLAAQRAAVGTRVGTMPPNASPADKNNFIRALAQLGLAQYMTLPSADWTVQLLNETSSRFDFLGLINHHNSQMSKSVLAQWFDSESGAGAGQGDSTLVDFGKQNDTTFMMMLEGILEEMAEVINNHVFPRFVDWNFGSEKYPKFKWGALTAEQKAAIQDTFDKLAAAGQTANVTPEFMLELEQRMSEELGLNIDYDKIKKDREKQQKLMAQQAQQQMAAGGAAGAPPGPPVMAGQTAGNVAAGGLQGPPPAPAPQPAPAGT